MTAFQWTPSKIADVRRAAAAGESSREVMERLGCTKGSLMGTASRHGIRFNSAKSNAALKGTGKVPRAKRAGREVRSLIDAFAEHLANGASVESAGEKVYGHAGSGRIAFIRLCHKLGPQAQ